MVGLTVTGILLLFATVTLVLLVLVIMQKEPPETTDLLDRVLLIASFSALGVAMFFGGLSFLGGVLSDSLPPDMGGSVWFSNVLYILFIFFG